MPEYNVAITGTFFEASLAAVFHADDVAQFQSATRAAAGLELGDETISVQYEDADFGEYCEVDGAHFAPLAAVLSAPLTPRTTLRRLGRPDC